jgi:putative ABC transport system permease protein
VSIAGSTAGPVYLRSADDSTVTSALQQAPLGATDVQFSAPPGEQGLPAVMAAAGAAVRLHHDGWFTSPVLTVDAGVTVPTTGQLYGADLLARSGVCQRVRFVAGRCPTSTGSVAVSVRSAGQARVRLGQSLRLGRLHAGGVEVVKVVGVYQPPASLADGYWQNEDYFDFGTQPSFQPPQLDAVLATQATALSVGRIGVVPDVSGFVTLRPGSVRAGAVAGFVDTLRSFESSLGTRFGVTGSSDAASVLAGASHGEHVLGTVVTAIILQLVLLALLVLYALVGLSARDRQLEAAIARRRGFTRPSLLVVAAGEPLLLLAMSLPVGIALAWVAVKAVGGGLFVGGTPVGLNGSAVLAALVAFGGGVLATVAASWSLWHGADRPGEVTARTRSASAAIDALAVALAAAGLVALVGRGSLNGSSNDPVASLAPGLLAIGAGVIGLRLIGLLLTAGVRATRLSPRVALSLALREMSRRRPSVLRQVLPLTAAVVLTVFAVDAWAVADTNRVTVAAFDTGAARVADVNVPAGTDLAAAVDRADPTGRQAMAVVVAVTGTGNLLAVQASRLAAVASWPTGLTAQSIRRIARYLTPTVAPPIVFTGGRIRATVNLSPGAPPTDLSATVFNQASQDETTVNVGTLRPGTGTYIASLGGACDSPCRLVNLSPTSPEANAVGSGRVSLTLAGLSTPRPGGGWRPLNIHPTPGSWTAVSASVAVHARARSITFTVAAMDLVAQGILLQPADIPAAIPAVVTEGLLQDNAPQPPDDAISVTGLDGGALNLSAAIQVAALPQIGGNAAMVDLDFAQLAESSLSQAGYQVWLSADASPDVLRRLRAVGVNVTGVHRAGSLQASLDKGPLGLAYSLVLASAPVASVLAVGATGFVMLASRRRRRSELGGLADAGVPTTVLRRSVFYETATVLGVALILGGAVGVVASRLALASLPQFVNGSGGVPISHHLQTAPLAGVLGGLAALLGGTALAVTATTVGRATLTGADRP